MKMIGMFEAKTHLASLLEKVEAGESIIITRHGKEVAHLVPPPGKTAQADVVAAVAKWKKARKGVRLGKGLKMSDLIAEGSR